METSRLSLHQMTWRKASLQLPGLNHSEWTVDSAWFPRKLPPSRTGSRLLHSRTGLGLPIASLEAGLCISPVLLVRRSGEKTGNGSGLRTKEVRKAEKGLPKSREIRSPTFRKRLFGYVSRSNYSLKAQKHWAAQALAYQEVSKLAHRSDISLAKPKLPCEMRISTAELTKRKPVKKLGSQLSGGETPLTPWRAAEF